MLFSHRRRKLREEGDMNLPCFTCGAASHKLLFSTTANNMHKTSLRRLFALHIAIQVLGIWFHAQDVQLSTCEVYRCTCRGEATTKRTGHRSCTCTTISKDVLVKLSLVRRGTENSSTIMLPSATEFLQTDRARAQRDTKSSHQLQRTLPRIRNLEGQIAWRWTQSLARAM